MAKVISLNSRMYLGGNDCKENDELASAKGIYIGMLPLKNAKELRELQDKLGIEQIQINQLVEESEEHYRQYINEINRVFKKYKYGIQCFNCEIENLLIGEDGHMWIIKNNDKYVKY